MCMEMDMCFHNHAKLEKPHKLETENAAKALKSFQQEKNDAHKIEEVVKEKEKHYEPHYKT